MIYATEFNPVTLQCTSVSVDSGFESIEQAAELLPDCKVTKRMILCAGVVFSDYKYCIDVPKTIT